MSIGTTLTVADQKAAIAALCWVTAYRQWLAAEDNADLATMTETVLSLLATIVPASASTGHGKASKARRTGADPIPHGRRRATATRLP